MIISSFGGKILNQTVSAFPEVAAYQPVINGVAGNLVSVQVHKLTKVGKTKNPSLGLFNARL